MSAKNGKSEKNEYPKASNGLVFGALLAYGGGMALMMAFCSPYWIESYEETMSSFKNMGLWEYCFKDFVYPYYPFPKVFNGCHNIFSHEYYIIRGWLVPGWLIAVQFFVTLAFIVTFFALVVMCLELIRFPLKTVLRYEWVMTRLSFVCCAFSSLCLFLGVAIFGGNAYRRDFQMYPKFNVLAWSYSLACVAFIALTLASLVLLRESKRAYELRSEAKNLVAQMEMQEPGYHAHGSRPHSRSTTGGYM